MVIHWHTHVFRFYAQCYERVQNTNWTIKSPRGKPTVVLLDIRAVKLPSKYVYTLQLYTIYINTFIPTDLLLSWPEKPPSAVGCGSRGQSAEYS